MKFPTRKSFALWLACRQAEIVGVPGSACDCPLARFLKSLGWNPQLLVCSANVKDTLNCVDLPKWAQCFVATIDAVGKPEGTLGETALNVLHFKGRL